MWPFSITEKDQVCLFKFWEIKLVQFFLIHFKEVALKLLAPICKRENSSIHSCGFFPPEVSLPVLYEGVQFSSSQSLSAVQLFATSWTIVCQMGI